MRNGEGGFVMPKTREAAERQAERSKRALAEGLLALLAEKDLPELSVTMLCERTHVSRTTFYRHFSRLEDVLAWYVDGLLATYTQTHPVGRDYADDVREFVTGMPLSRELLKMLHDRHLMWVLGDAFERRVAFAMGGENFVRLLGEPRYADYQQRFIVDTLLSVLGTWVERGFAERPEELAEVLAKLVVTV